MAETPDAEILLCDSSFVGHIGRRQTMPAEYAHWSLTAVDRIDQGILAISVVTLAESRYGYLAAGWGQRRVEADERRLQAFLRVPLDMSVVEEWARLKHATRTTQGLAIGDNDLWIAATASARGYPLVTCDNDQGRIQDAALEVLYLPPRPA